MCVVCNNTFPNSKSCTVYFTLKNTVKMRSIIHWCVMYYTFPRMLPGKRVSMHTNTYIIVRRCVVLVYGKQICVFNNIVLNRCTMVVLTELQMYDTYLHCCNYISSGKPQCNGSVYARPVHDIAIHTCLFFCLVLCLPVFNFRKGTFFLYNTSNHEQYVTFPYSRVIDYTYAYKKRSKYTILNLQG